MPGIALLLLCTSAAQANDFWTSLWRNADQRGERLLRRGDAAGAAHTYADPRRRAYAQLLAGDYQGAANGFGAFDDSDAHYNRGNALAHAGELQAALQAYDAALARNPDNEDARHNRDLVRRALQQQRKRQGQPGKGGQNGQQAKGGQEQQSHGQGGKQDGRQGGKDNQSGNTGQGQGGQAGQPPPGKQAGGKPAASQAAGQPEQGQEHGQTGQASAQTPQDNAEQARRDAAAALANEASKVAEQGARQADQAADETAGSAGEERGTRAGAVPSERQLAQEQWLRMIPDDPGGLLRRKFMIEHLMRQQGNQP
jgi:Ca-activated chloride channel family protein